MNKVFTRRIGDSLETKIINEVERLNEEKIFRTMRSLGFDLDRSKTIPGNRYFLIMHSYQVDQVVEAGFKSIWHRFAFWLSRSERVNTVTYRVTKSFPDYAEPPEFLNPVFVSSKASGQFPTFHRGVPLVWEESFAL